MALSRDLIVETAAQLFRKKGYSSTTVADIAAQLGVTKAALYYYITGKEELLYAIFDRTMAAAEKRLDSLMCTEMSVPERIRAIIFNHIMAVFDEAPYISVFFTERAQLDLPAFRPIKERRKAYERRIAVVIQDGMQQGALRQVDVMPVVYAILGMCNWLYHWYNPQGRLKPEELAELYAGIVLGGLLR